MYMIDRLTLEELTTEYQNEVASGSNCSEIYETNVCHSFRVYNESGSDTLRFYSVNKYHPKHLG